jgi:hypothetical protein
MHRVQYAGGSVLTGDDIATALLEYAAALARNASSATVEIPVREADGERGVAQVLIGPASQFVSTHEPGNAAEIEDAALVESFSLATRRLAPASGSPLVDGESPMPSEEFDLPEL